MTVGMEDMVQEFSATARLRQSGKTSIIVPGNGQQAGSRLIRRSKKDRPIIHRDAMGDYLVPSGGKPLTSLGDARPSPADYSPRTILTKRAPPHYSVAGPYRRQKANYNASPADNDTSRDMEWTDRQSTLKGKGQTKPYDIRAEAHLTDSLGPLAYNVDKHDVGGFGSSGQKYSIAKRNIREGGPPNSLVQPVDTAGVDNPAPTYRPNSAYWGHGEKKTFGSSRKWNSPSVNPGPAEYNIQAHGEIGEGPAITLASHLPPPLTWQQATSTESPGPGAYQLETCIGQSVSKSLSGRHTNEKEDFVPAPNMYTLPDKILDAPSAPMPGRWVEPEDKPHPGPTKYKFNNTCNLEQAATYSMRKLTRPCFPDVLHYPLIASEQVLPEGVPGPGRYSCERQFKDNDKPKFSMRITTKRPTSEVPGANHYNVGTALRPDALEAPAFSMRKRFEARHCQPNVNPGPAAYYPKPELFHNGTGKSMTRRPKEVAKFVTPAPNSYKLKKNKTRIGTTFKGRPSSYIYSGVQVNVNAP